MRRMWMTDINWPKLICPHCGNRTLFTFEILAHQEVSLHPAQDHEFGAPDVD